jgi:hypothetical protein
MLSDMAAELEGHVVCQVCHLKPVIGSSTVHIPWHDMRPHSQFWLDYSYGFTHLSARLWCLQSGMPLVLWLALRWSLIRIYIVHVCRAGSAIEFIAKSTEKIRPQCTWQKPLSRLGRSRGVDLAHLCARWRWDLGRIYGEIAPQQASSNITLSFAPPLNVTQAQRSELLFEASSIL